MPRLAGLFVQCLPEFVGAARRIHQPLQQGPDVEPGAAHHDGPFAAGADVADRRVGRLGKIGRREGLVGIGHVDQVVGDPARCSAVGLAVPISMPR